jgi:hypothetical protein
MKKFIVALVFIAATMIPVFAQESEASRKFAVTLDPIPLIIGPLLGGFGFGASFEFAPITMASARASVYYIGMKFGDSDGAGSYAEVKLNYLAITGEGRFYPFKTGVEGFFLDAGMAFVRLGGNVVVKSEGESASGDAHINAFSVLGGLGYKIVFGKSRVGFFLEPALSYRYIVSSDIDWKADNGLNLVATILGIKGFGFALNMGVAF